MHLVWSRIISQSAHALRDTLVILYMSAVEVLVEAVGSLLATQGNKSYEQLLLMPESEALWMEDGLFFEHVCF